MTPGYYDEKSRIFVPYGGKSGKPFVAPPPIREDYIVERRAMPDASGPGSDRAFHSGQEQQPDNPRRPLRALKAERPPLAVPPVEFRK